MGQFWLKRTVFPLVLLDFDNEIDEKISTRMWFAFFSVKKNKLTVDP